jgi:5-methylthioadenosine/S-adenosylhomocysteine deaminase
MPTTHIKRLEIVTLDAEGTIHHDADLVIRDGRIAHIGSAPGTLKADEVIDGSGRVAVPGLFNAHCHSPMTFERGWADALRPLAERENLGGERPDARRRMVGRGAGGVRMIRSGTVGFNTTIYGSRHGGGARGG